MLSLSNIMKNPYKIINLLDRIGLSRILNDETYVRFRFRANMNKRLNLNNPQTYNEKLQWLKLYNHRPEHTKMVDKYEAKKYVADTIGEEYVIPTLGVWDKFDDIDFSTLPKQFVLKCTHDSGGLVICKDKEKFDKQAARKKIEKSLNYNYYWKAREWPYKNVPPRIIAEKYMANSDGKLNDFKIYTFNGKAKICMINQDRGFHTRADYFDKDFNWLDFSWGYDHADTPPLKPLNYIRMFELAEELSKDTPELRVDFYEVDGKIYFGELTFFDSSGFDKIEPLEWDYKLGSWVILPHEK